MTNLNLALETGTAKIEYPGIIEIYPRKFMNTTVLNALLIELKPTHNFYKVFNVIRAFEKEKTSWDYGIIS